jgi:hypothetical protein
MALSKIQAESMNLADTYAFSGTVTGVDNDEIKDADGDTKIEIEATSDDDIIKFSNAGSESMRIKANGTIGIGTAGGSYRLDVESDSNPVYFHAVNGVGVYLASGGNSWSTASDKTLKGNIKELDKQESYDNLKNIRAVKFNYVADEQKKDRLGFIAQEWQTKYPELIVTDANKKLGLNYTDTIAVLLSALQKSQQKIESLETRVTALEKK